MQRKKTSQWKESCRLKFYPLLHIGFNKSWVYLVWLPVTVHLHCQHDWAWNHLGDTPLGVPVRVFLEVYLRRGDPPWTWKTSSLRLNKWRKWDKYQGLSLCASRLQIHHDQLPHLTPLKLEALSWPQLPHHDGLHPYTVDQKESFCPQVVPVRPFCCSNKKNNWSGEIAHWVKVHAGQGWWPNFYPWNPYKDGKRYKWPPVFSSDINTCIMVHVHFFPFPHNHNTHTQTNNSNNEEKKEKQLTCCLWKKPCMSHYQQWT